MKVAISACLAGQKCRYDGNDNHDIRLISKLEGCELILFCPEDYAFGSPRARMDLVQTAQGIRAISDVTGADLSMSIEQYAQTFFKMHPDIDLFIGKDRSPSCGVCSAKLYDKEKKLLSTEETGLMAKEAKKRGICALDAEDVISPIVFNKG
ncbi:MAG: hypothetical protein QG564_161 [Campylobacterota bacterium]|nr:hypothetical protein [Campylobacterota bacterium]